MTPTILPSAINPAGRPPDAQNAEGKARLELVDRLRWLERLNGSADFARFLKFVQDGADHCQAEAEKITTHDAATRDAFAQKHFAYAGIARYAEKAAVAAEAALKTLDEKQRAV